MFLIIDTKKCALLVMLGGSESNVGHAVDARHGAYPSSVTAAQTISFKFIICECCWAVCFNVTITQFHPGV
jgi:hypothetical protein